MKNEVGIKNEVGRPTVPDEDRKDYRIQSYVTPDVFQWLEAQAKRHNRSRSDMLNMILKKHVYAESESHMTA